MEAAADVLASKGFAGTRLSDIADVAQLQAPAIYYYFDSREALIEAVVMEGTKVATLHVEEILAGTADASPAERILAAVEAHLRVALEESAFALASIRNAGQLPAEMRAKQQQAEARYGKMWRGLIADLESDGMLRPGLNPLAAQMLVIGALNWAPEWWTAKVASLDEVVETAKALIAGGLFDGAATRSE